MTKSKAAPYMKTWIVEEIADTAGMTQAQCGAYWLLKMAMWRAGGKLPANDAALANITRCKPAEWAAMRDRVLSLFQRRGGIIRQERMTEAIFDYENSFCSHSIRGKKGAAEKAKKNNENAGSSADAQLKPSRHNQNQNQKEERASKKALSSDASGPRKKSRRHVESEGDERPPPNWAAHPEVWNAVLAERGLTFCASYLARSTWRDGSIRPWSGQAMMELAKVRCLPEMGISILLAEGEKAA